MGTADNFCLRWNDFESNISSSFRELRRDNEFFDVTLCCDNGSDKVSAHKVILAACSPLFRRILGHNSGNPNPLLYLKGINKKELTAVLNFMYHGEVNVAQDSLNAFLAVAEELAVKGLTTDSNPDGSGYHRVTSGGGVDDDPDYTPRKGPGRPPKKAKTPSSARKRELDGEDSNSGDIKRVKAEPDVVVSENQAGGAVGGSEDFGDDQGPDFGGGEGYDDNFGGYDDLDETGADASGSGEVTKVREEASFLRSKRGNAMLVDSSGYHYFVNKKRETRMYWKCLKCRSHGCRARAVTEGFYIVSKTSEHTHEPASAPTTSFGVDYD